LPKACGHVHTKNLQHNVLCRCHGLVLRAQRLVLKYSRNVHWPQKKLKGVHGVDGGQCLLILISTLN